MLHTVAQLSNNYKKNFPRIVPIAPAPERKYNMDSQSEVRRYNCRSNSYTGAQASSIARRNARERNRVKQVNDGFNALRKRLPTTVIASLSGASRRGSGKKLSKVDTLRMVVEYIKYLQDVIEESDAALGITNKKSQCYDTDEGVFTASSPYLESVPSPVDSECSSGVSSGYSNNEFYQNDQASAENLTPMEEDELLDAISWWQNK